jgi:hypothetical protein
MVISRRRAATGALILLCSVAVTSETSAQGFFQSLFGFGSPPAAQRPAQPSTPPGYGYREPVRPPYSTPSTEPRSDQPSSGRFRTVCVRLCDGYYYPLSASASRRDLRRDALSCKASCGTEARLFYQSSSASDASGLVDVTGLAYARLPNAFRYRKTLVDGCKCKPDPWAASELDRHRAYALAEQATNGSGSTPTAKSDGAPASAPAEVIAGSPAPSSEKPVRATTMTQLPTEEAPAPVARPAPRLSSAPAARASQRPTQRVSDHMPKPSAAPRPERPMPSAPLSGLFGNGGSSLRWPGD